MRCNQMRMFYLDGSWTLADMERWVYEIFRRNLHKCLFQLSVTVLLKDTGNGKETFLLQAWRKGRRRGSQGVVRGDKIEIETFAVKEVSCTGKGTCARWLTGATFPRIPSIFFRCLKPVLSKQKSFDLYLSSEVQAHSAHSLQCCHVLTLLHTQTIEF